MTKRLLLISDLWGRAKSGWIMHYTQMLETCFDVVYYDSCELAGIDASVDNAERIHTQFVTGGIEKSVQKLIELEKGRSSILAFSIGGVIAWKYGLETEKPDALTCVSSTRLRNETRKPNGAIRLYFGENDPFKPTPEWFETLNPEFEILKDRGHLMYRDPEFAKALSERIIEKRKGAQNI